MRSLKSAEGLEMNSQVRRVGFLFTAAALVALAITSIANPVTAWPERTPRVGVAVFGGRTDDKVTAVVADVVGNIYVTGYFHDSMDIDPGPASLLLREDPDHDYAVELWDTGDAFVAKFNANGDLVWAKRIGGNGQDGGNAIAVNASGDVYVSGFFTRRANFDPGLTDFALTAPNGVHTSIQHAFLMKLDSFGRFSWAIDGGHGRGRSLAILGNGVVVQMDGKIWNVNSSGSVDWTIASGCRGALHVVRGSLFVGGWFTDVIDADPGPAELALTSNGGLDACLAKYSSAGLLEWAKSFGGESDDRISDITSTGDSLIVGGAFWRSADFDPSSSNAIRTSMGRSDYFVAQFDMDGGFSFVQTFGSLRGEDSDLRLTSSGSKVWGAVNFSAPIEMTSEGKTIATKDGLGSFILIVKISVFSNASPNIAWFADAGGGNSGRPSFSDLVFSPSMTINEDGVKTEGVVAVGGFAGSPVDFDPGEGTAAFRVNPADTSPTQWSDGFIWALTESGALLSSKAPTEISVSQPSPTSPVPSGITVSQPSLATTGLSSKGTTVGVIKRGETMSAKALTKAAKITTPRGSRVLLKISKTSSKRCKLSTTGVKGIAVGQCTVTVTVVAASGKRSSKTVSMRVA